MEKVSRASETCSTLAWSTIWWKNPARGSATKENVLDRAARMRARSSRRTRKSLRAWKPRYAKPLASSLRRRPRQQRLDRMAHRIIIRNHIRHSSVLGHRHGGSLKLADEVRPLSVTPEQLIPEICSLATKRLDRQLFVRSIRSAAK